MNIYYFIAQKPGRFKFQKFGLIDNSYLFVKLKKIIYFILFLRKTIIFLIETRSEETLIKIR